MSIIDTKLLLSDDQAVTSTAASENVLDLGTGYDAFGTTRVPKTAVGRAKWLNVLVTEAFDASGSATMQIGLEYATSEDFNTGKEVTLITPAIGKASLTAGVMALRVPLPEVQKRYFRTNYTVASGPMTAGKVTTWLSES